MSRPADPGAGAPEGAKASAPPFTEGYLMSLQMAAMIANSSRGPKEPNAFDAEARDWAIDALIGAIRRDESHLKWIPPGAIAAIVAAAKAELRRRQAASAPPLGEGGNNAS